GHHSDDNAELVLLYLFRGSGPLGISGIPPVRDGTIVRPLIKITRAEIIDYLAVKGLEYVCDKSNIDPRFRRNRLRHQLIPTLKKDYNPLIIQSINRVSSILRSEEEWIEKSVTPIFDNSVSVMADDKIFLSIPKLNDIHIAAIRRVIRRAIATIKGDLRRISFKHIDAITRLIQSGPAYGRLDLPGRIRIGRDNEILLFLKEKQPLRSLNIRSKGAQSRKGALVYEYEIKEPGTLFIKAIDMHLKFIEIDIKILPDFGRTGHSAAFFDMDKLEFPLTLRNFRKGDRFTPLGMTGTQKVKKYFINNKVPRAERARCPLLLSQGKIVWIVGHRIDESVKVMPTTRNVLKVEPILA
ncbi:tRNA lysidine(34) synthetase TilS, partial [Thermodesulfobacteriota bacterium]